MVCIHQLYQLKFAIDRLCCRGTKTEVLRLYPLLLVFSISLSQSHIVHVYAAAQPIAGICNTFFRRDYLDPFCGITRQVK